MHLLPERYILYWHVGFWARTCQLPGNVVRYGFWLVFEVGYPEAGTIIGRWGRKPVVQIHYRCLVQSPCHVRFPWDAEPEPVTLIGWDKLWVLESDTLIINQADTHRARIMIQIPQLSQYWKFLLSFVVDLSCSAAWSYILWNWWFLHRIAYKLGRSAIIQTPILQILTIVLSPAAWLHSHRLHGLGPRNLRHRRKVGPNHHQCLRSTI